MSRSAFAVLFLTSFLAACSPPPAPPVVGCGTFGAWTDAFPVPVDDATSVFDFVDDDFLEWSFTQGFTFPFYGTTYDSVFLNTNGGMTFGAGDDEYDVAATDVTSPAIAVFWGDMDAAEYGGVDRANQMRWRQSPSCFQVSYDRFQDNDEETWDNTAVVTLHDDGRIVIQYGTVRSEDLLIGVFDGTHTDNRTPPLQGQYVLSQHGTGVILYDYWSIGGEPYDGALDGETIIYLP